MKIERVSDTQMKFVLMNHDLEERDIKLAELSYASGKTQQLFREIMQLVQGHQEFSAEDTPLMFEAMRVGADSLVVVVTKISNLNSPNKRFNMANPTNNNQPSPPHVEDGTLLVLFDCIDDMATATARLCGHYKGLSKVYKMDGRYFLLMENEPASCTIREMETILCEFGHRHVSNVISRNLLAERGEVIIADDAVNKLHGYLNCTM